MSITVSGTIAGELVDRRTSSVELGTSLALTLATRSGDAGTLYVREDGVTRTVVERHPDRTVTIRRQP